LFPYTLKIKKANANILNNSNRIDKLPLQGENYQKRGTPLKNKKISQSVDNYSLRQ
jgi:hypothetical protein